jgi:hypothetical protein
VSLKRSIKAATDSPFRIPLGPARFCLDDVNDICDALIDFTQQQSAGDSSANADVPRVANAGAPSVEIRALTATADEVEDLKDATRSELDHLSLILSAPKIRLDLWSHTAEIIAESDTSDVRKFVEGLRSFTVTRRRWTAPLRRVAKTVLPLYLLFLLSLVIPSLPRSWGLESGRGIYGYLNRYTDAFEWLFVIVVIVSTIIAYVNSRDVVRVVPAWRKESRGISQRSRRDIAVALIAAIISAAIIAVAGLWAGVYAK